MSEKTSSQQQKKSTNPLFGMADGIGVDALRKMADENMARTHTMMEEFGKFEASSREQMSKAIDAAERMMNESLNYAAQLSAEWRRASFDAAQKTIEMMTPNSK